MDYGSALKKTVKNPNRRSARYTRQPRFSGSDREIRGRVLKALIKNPWQNEIELAGSIPCDRKRGARIISTLIQEGFVVRDGENLTIRDF
jgi:A/G-specific adenine glycosylase